MESRESLQARKTHRNATMEAIPATYYRAQIYPPIALFCDHALRSAPSASRGACCRHLSEHN
eukprot:6458711-Amphidinium_carterae.2